MEESENKGEQGIARGQAVVSGLLLGLGQGLLDDRMTILLPLCHVGSLQTYIHTYTHISTHTYFYVHTRNTQGYIYMYIQCKFHISRAWF